MLTHETAVLTEPTPEAFARGIEELIENPDKGRVMAAAATQAVTSKYSVAHFRAKVAAAIQQVSGGRTVAEIVPEPSIKASLDKPI